MNFLYDNEITEENASFLSEVPIGVYKENFRTQFKDPDNYRVDYFTSFLESYEYSKSMIESDDEADELKRVHDSLLDFLEEEFSVRLGIGIPEFGEMGEEDQHDLMLMMYRYFVIRIQKNFLNVYTGYLEEHKDTLAAYFPEKTDITTHAYMAELDPVDVTLIANLSEVMNLITSADDMDVDTFLSLSMGEKGNTEASYLAEAYDKTILTGNFIPLYARLVRNSLRIKLEADLRNHILRKYRKK